MTDRSFSTRRRISALALTAAFGASLGLAACGDDDGSDVRELEDSSGSGSDASSSSVSDSGSAPADE